MFRVQTGIGPPRERIARPACHLRAKGIRHPRAEHRAQGGHGRGDSGRVVQTFDLARNRACVEPHQYRRTRRARHADPLLPETICRAKKAQPVQRRGPERAGKAQPALVQKAHPQIADCCCPPRVQAGAEPQVAGLQHTQRHCHHGAVRPQGAAIGQCHRHARTIGCQALHHRAKADVQALCQMPGQGVIAIGEQLVRPAVFAAIVEVPGRKPVPVGGIFLLDRCIDGVAEPPPRGGVQRLPVTSALHGGLQRDVGVGILYARPCAFDHILGVLMVAVKVHPPPLGIPGGSAVIGRHGAPRPGRIGKCGQGVAPCAMDPACAQIDRQVAPVAAGPDAPADAVARLQHGDLSAAVRQRPRGPEARHPASDHGHAQARRGPCPCPRPCCHRHPRQNPAPSDHAPKTFATRARRARSASISTPAARIWSRTSDAGDCTRS